MTEDQVSDAMGPEFVQAVQVAVAAELDRLREEQRAAAELAEQQAREQAEAEATARRAADDAAAAEHARWEGHSHTWGRASKGMRSCKECPLEVPADLIESAS